MTKPIPLPSFQELQSWFNYEPETGLLKWRKRSGQRTPAGSEAGNLSARGYRHVRFQGKSYSAHRICWYLATGMDPGEMEVDHINKIRHDNRIANLRLATSSENKCNRSGFTGNSSGHRNVYRNKANTKWEVRIKKNNSNHHLGSYMSLEEAVVVADLARQQMHGAFTH